MPRPSSFGPDWARRPVLPMLALFSNTTTNVLSTHTRTVRRPWLDNPPFVRAHLLGLWRVNLALSWNNTVWQHGGSHGDPLGAIVLSATEALLKDGVNV